MNLRGGGRDDGGWGDRRVWALTAVILVVIALDLAQHPIVFLPLLAVPLLLLVFVAKVRVVVELSVVVVVGAVLSSWENDYFADVNGVFWVSALLAVGVLAVVASVARTRVEHGRAIAEQRLEESERYFRVLAENATDLVFLAKLDKKLEWAAPSVERVLGWSPAEMQGHDIADFVRPEGRNAFEEMRAPLRRSDGTAQAVELEFEVRCKDGHYAWLAGTARPIFAADGTPDSVVVGLRDVTEKHLAHEELLYRALHDPLTGLRNRAWILDMLGTDLRAAQRDQSLLGLMFVDLDNFKDVNDSFGHQAGDVVLRRIAERISSSMRPGDRVGRFGGDEFVIVIPGIRDPGELEAMGDRVGSAIARELDVEGQVVVPSASIGIAVSDDGSTPESLLRDADAALFRAKDAGRARWVFFGRSASAETEPTRPTCAELTRALDRGELVLHYQPIVRLDDARIVGHEALLRWNHPTRGLMFPMEFLPVARECGLLVRFGERVINDVCELLAARPELLGPVSVNVAPEELSSPTWAANLLSALERHQIDPLRLILEITEKSLRAVGDSTRSQLMRLREAGIGLHLDDFGIGRSSVGLLRELPLTGLKLDASLTRRLDSEDSIRELTAGLSGLADGLRLMSVAEGIENSAEAQLLREQGWTYAQGYYYGRPGPVPNADDVSATPAG